MRKVLTGLLIVLSILTLSALMSASNQLGVADKYQIKLSENTRVADTLLPKGNYEIRHVMEGSDHIMVFRQLGTRKPIEVRAKCKLVPLDVKADMSQQIFALNAANERVLSELVFKGESAKHVF